jgi:hypothetical protein
MEPWKGLVTVAAVLAAATLALALRYVIPPHRRRRAQTNTYAPGPPRHAPS